MVPGVWLARAHGSVRLMMFGFSRRHIPLYPTVTLPMFILHVLHGQSLVGLSVRVDTTGSFSEAELGLSSMTEAQTVSTLYDF